MNTLSSLLNWIGTTIGANPNTLTTTSKTLVGAINEVMSNLYPVGSYFWTSDGTFNPQTAWGGTWEKMDEGLVLVSAGTNYPISAGVHSDGGSKDAVLVAHTHTVSGGAHSHPISSKYKEDELASGSAKTQYTSNGNKTSTALSTIASNTGTHTHTVSTNGVSGTGKNMPPYKNAYCWHRVA